MDKLRDRVASLDVASSDAEIRAAARDLVLFRCECTRRSDRLLADVLLRRVAWVVGLRMLPVDLHNPNATQMIQERSR